MRDLDDDSTYFLKAFAVFASACIIALVAWIWIHSSHVIEIPRYESRTIPTYPAPPKPARITRTVAFMPGQYTDIPNHAFRKIEIHSTFPIRVVSGACNLQYGVEFVCDSAPSDIFITDMRPKPIFSTPQGNQITITATQF